MGLSGRAPSCPFRLRPPLAPRKRVGARGGRRWKGQPPSVEPDPSPDFALGGERGAEGRPEGTGAKRSPKAPDRHRQKRQKFWQRRKVHVPALPDVIACLADRGSLPCVPPGRSMRPVVMHQTLARTSRGHRANVTPSDGSSEGQGAKDRMKAVLASFDSWLVPGRRRGDERGRSPHQLFLR